MTRQEYINQYRLDKAEEIQKFRDGGASEELIDQFIGKYYDRGDWIHMVLHNLRPEEGCSRDDRGMSQLFSDVFKDHCTIQTSNVYDFGCSYAHATARTDVLA